MPAPHGGRRHPPLEERVVAVVAGQIVVASAALELVISGTADERVVTIATEQRGQCRLLRSGSRCHRRPRVDRRPRLRRVHRRPAPAQVCCPSRRKGNRSPRTDQVVRASVADQLVGARAAVENIVAGHGERTAAVTDELIVVVSADQRI